MNNFKEKSAQSITALLLAMLIPGCASDIKTVTMTPDQGKLVTGKTITTPAGVKRLKAALGEDMFTNEQYFITPGTLEFNTATMQSAANAKIKHKLKTISFNLPPAHLSSEGYSSEGQHYTYPRSFVSNNDTPAYGGLIAPIETPEIATKIYWHWSPKNAEGLYYSAPLSKPVHLNIEKIEKDSTNEAHKPLTQALIYSGVSDGKIRFIYREYTRGGYSRPDFTQDVTLNYTPGEEYAFKSARFVVEKAGNSFIDFILIKGF
ncbi:hypothetical protein HNE05_18525 [Aquipseudomonas campi]|uniref:Lipoprotein n=1 Tax=Aquipseudomonas campi TaxID=2731681 RepID=A0A6M8FZN2_9GAMM|nr:hypothetical protein [Pseudomonas campi]QKE65266.1 hypothetical protein HNE05_18525 [Pseudomonas campi]